MIRNICGNPGLIKFTNFFKEPKKSHLQKMIDPHPPFASFAPSLIILIAVLETLNIIIQKNGFLKERIKFDLNNLIKIISIIGLTAVILAFISGYFANGFIDQKTNIGYKDKLINLQSLIQELLENMG